ncbi:uncharacterized protein LOC110050037 [Orbicella faveolata]|uniref:uncharacterized protein LOC110050037 n=1 Tax=Orbicella faveolata TaxID=48498 RepID=UPI0009E59888|nr:uncharacterized protein LOC110050037 [Orbicella faveolata]
MAGDIWLFRPLCFFPSYILTATLFSMTKFRVEGTYYCGHDWCNYNEYCCGDDVCCDYLTGYWYIWLMTGLLLFTLILACCWLRYHRYHSSESIESAKLGYVSVPGTVVTYGDEYYIHQQPPQVPFAREPPHFTTPLESESQQHESSRYYPPPFNYIERRTPSAPPEDTY